MAKTMQAETKIRPTGTGHGTVPEPARVAPAFGARDAIVVLAILLVGGGAAVAAHMQLDLPEPISAAIGLAVACVLLALHVVVMRMAQPVPPRVTRAGTHAPARPRPSSAEPLAVSPRVPYMPVAPAPAPAPALADPDAITAALKTLSAERRDPHELDHQPVIEPHIETGPDAHDVRRELVISQSIAALRSTAEQLAAPANATLPARHVEPSLDHPSQLTTRPEPDAAIMAPAPYAQSPATAEAAKLADIADAIQSQRLETAVSVIPSLSDEQVQHHEIIVRLKTRTGEMLVPEDIQSIARTSGLLPLLEALKIGRAVRLATALVAEGCGGALLSSLTADVLLNDRAMQTLIQPLDGGDERVDPSARHVVLSFPESETRRFTDAHWSRLADLADMGFRFAMEQAADLYSDFDLLQNVGFLFLKVDVGVMRQGLPGPGGAVQEADLARHVAQLGLTLIVSRIDNATDLSHLTSVGVPFGQGGLFRAQERIALIAGPDAGRGVRAA